MAGWTEIFPRNVEPRTKLKVVWYLLLSAVGLFHAEVLSWSSPDVLYNPLTFALVAPVYVVHYVLFGDLMGRRQGDLRVLYLFGCLTGMYETFITKVYWSPPWNPLAAGVLGVAWVELLWIGFTWHAFMTFLIPFVLMRRLFTPGGDGRSRKALTAIFLSASGMSAVFGYAFGQSLTVMLPPLLLSFAVILLLALLFLRGASRWGFRGVEQLRFGPWGRRAAIGAFVAVYAAYGVFLRPEFFPLGLPLLPILLIYVGLTALTVAVWRQATPLPTPAEGVKLDGRGAVKTLLLYLLVFLGVFLALGGVHVLLPSVLSLLAVLLILASVGVPVVLLGILTVQALRGRRASEPGLPEPTG